MALVNRYTHCWYTTEVQDSSSRAIFVSDLSLSGLNVLAVLVSAFANGFVLYKYVSCRTRQPISNTLLFLLAIFDLIQAIASQPLFIVTRILETQGIFSCRLNVANKIVGMIFAGISFIMATIILTSERLFAIVYPIRHRVLMRKRPTIAVTLAVFVLFLTLVISLTGIWDKEIELIITLSGIVIFGLAYTVGVYFKIFCISRKHGAIVASNYKTESSTSEITSRKRRPSFIKVDTPGRSTITSVTNYSIVPEDTNSVKLLESKCGNLVLNATDHPAESLTSNGRSLEEQDRASNVQVHKDSSPVVLSTRETRSKGDITLGAKTWCDFQKESICLKQMTRFTRKKDQKADVRSRLHLSHQEKKTILRMLCIVGAVYICYLPALLFFAYTIFYGVDVFFVKYFYAWAVTFCFVNTIVNPIIYCYRNEHFWQRKPRRFQASLSSSGHP